MRIYVVRQGDSIWSISRRFGVSQDIIINANGIQNLKTLVIGQALVIPGVAREYVVKPGDSIYSISRRFDVSPSSIMELNNIANPAALNPGQVIAIPAQAKNYGFLETNGYVNKPSGTEEDAKLVDDVGAYLTYITPFSHEVKEDGSLSELKDDVVLREAKRFRIAPLFSMSNIKNDAFDTNLGHTIVTNVNVQQTLINNVINVLRTKGYYGVNIDFERLPPEDRDAYNNFLRKVVAALKPLGYVVSTALAPKTYDVKEGSWHGAHDYKAHGEIVDFVVLMTYEWGWSGGPPLPVAPINEVRKVLNYAVSVMPPKKILMGMPMYGYDWTLPYTPGGQYAKALSPQAAVELAAKHGATILYDEKAQAPHFNYSDENGRQHVVWFDDARSVQAKYRMASELGLRGVSYWSLGQPFAQNWTVLDDMFNIVKVVR